MNFSLLADSFGPYPSSMLVAPSSYQNQAYSHTSPRAFSRSKQTTPLGPRGRSTSAPNVSFDVNTGTTEEVCQSRGLHQLQWLMHKSVCVLDKLIMLNLLSDMCTP